MCGYKQLAACSLVCKSWTLPAQLRMLHSSKLYRASQARSFISYLQCTGSAGNAVQYLELGRNSGERKDYISLSRWHIFEILRRCHRIRSLTLLQWRPDDVHSSMKSRSQFLPPISLDVLSHHDPFERLTSLRLHQYVGSFRKLVELLLLTTHLESFSFEGKTTSLDEVVLSSLPSPKFKLQRLSVAGYDGGFLDGIAWILSSSWRTLRRIDLGSMPGPIEPELLIGLRQQTNAITSLSLTLCQHTNIPTIIQCCPRLKELRIDGTFPELPIPNPSTPFSLRRCLLAVSTPSLTSLNLVFIGELSSHPALFANKRRVRLGRSPSAREVAKLIQDLDSIEVLSNLRSLTLEFNTNLAYYDAPISQFRSLRNYCSSHGIAVIIPDLCELVMGGRPSSNVEERRRRNRLFNIRV